MIRIKDLVLKDYIININVGSKQLFGIYGRDKVLIKDLLLIIAGINKNSDNCTYDEENVYDNERYFRNRIYLDCHKEYFQTIKATEIASGIKTKYHKIIDVERLQKHLKTLDVRGECEITYRYVLTKCGNTLLNMSLLLASDNHLIINNPTINVKRPSDIDYLTNELIKKDKIIILGVNSLKDLTNRLSSVLILTDFKEALLVNPQKDIFHVVDNNNLNFDKLFISNDNTKLIVKELTKEQLKICDKEKIKYSKINIYEIEKHI
jgi:hypothetical protein